MIVELLVIVIFSLVVPYSLALLVMRYREDWPRRKAAIASALPLAFLIWLPCAWVLTDAVLSLQDECGVDACGMAMMFSMIGMTAGLIAFGLGLGAALLAMRLSGRRVDVPADGEPFE